MGPFKRDWNFDDGEPENLKRGRTRETFNLDLISNTGNEQYPIEQAAFMHQNMNVLCRQHVMDSYLGASIRGISNLTPGYTRQVAMPNEPPVKTVAFNQADGYLGEVMCLYGTACEVEAKISTKTGVLEEARMPFTNGFCHLQVIRQRNYTLRDINGLDIAVLDRKTTKALKNLDERFRIQYSAYISGDQWNHCASSSTRTAKAVVVNVELNISGLRANSKDVGKILSRARIYLQHPRFQPKDMPYENPHYIVISDVNNVMPEVQNLDVTLQPTQNLVEAQSVDKIFDELDQHMHLKLASADSSIIKTKLQAHQEAAVDFVAQRESLKMSEAFCIWKHTTNEDMRSCYRHVVLGIKKPFRPNENFGGIIADEMGLGKTLSMLSAVALSLESAKHFSTKWPLRPEPQMNKTPTRATLIIVPSLLIMNGWMGEIDKHITPGYLKCERFHGQARDRDIIRLIDNDVVFTTYATITNEYFQGSSTLHQIMWYRIVLDEAHCICRQQTKRFLAIKSMDAQYRWCLTGTPIQNGLEDLGALVDFLRIPSLDSARFRSNVASPIEQGCKDGVSKLRSLLKCVCLRRTKHVIHLPEAHQMTRTLHLNAKERSQYQNIIMEQRRAIEHAVSTKNTSKDSNGLCQTILRLRLFCNHGFATVPHRNSRNSRNSTPQEMDEKFSFIEQNDRGECASCSQTIESIGDVENPRSGVYTGCAHLICSGCVSQENKFNGDGESPQFACPVCGKLTRPVVSGSSELARSASYESATYASTKLEALLNDLRTTQCTEKSIVFSAWTKTISIVMSLLTKERIRHSVVEGSMSISERTEALNRFHSPDTPVLLMTLGTGSVGLNLTLASCVYILEPQWNPFVESQAVGRALRLGQQKQVTVIRYILKDTIEEYIQDRQQQKSDLTTISWSEDQDNSANAKLRRFMDFSSVIERL
ncbi:hypothetical protein DM02DRAFT_588373 [Periconia macrospinosa]|uniref:Uncharacterized protein n=1 Tax=Periconia macrospinosa TaxID=97972 RepID=A0A2V1DXJ1_9PLEO|nr:hypothetical protein DM02DRAFT_588373 [Periconia macrospinosa]